jgi:hypothetical protein
MNSMSRSVSAMRPLRWLIVAALATVLLGVSTAAAGAATEIEGVWSFNGGEVAIHPVAGEKFLGTVVTPTKFAECAHQAGEAMWTGMTLQPDGSYWGFHQWLFEKTCAPNPEPGPTAWRVLHTSSGARYLKVCFSEPGKTQPTIAPDGAVAEASYGCKESTPIAPLPVVVSKKASGGGEQSGEQVSFANTILLPKASACLRLGTLKIKIHDPARDPLKEVVVKLGKRKLAVVKGVQRLKRGIVLKNLPSGSYTLTITATTVLDQKLSGKRTYHSCARHTAKGRRHRGKHHKHA